MATARPDPNPSPESAERFLRRCHRRLETVATTDEAREGAAALAAAIDRAEPREHRSSWLPVLDSVDQLDPIGRRTAHDRPGHDLVADLADLVPHLPWVPTHRATDGGTELALAPFDRVFDLDRTVVGLMYIGPGATYPLHHHPPQELYLTIAGQGRWRYGGHDGFETVGPGRTLYNNPGDLHSAVAGPRPVVALYVLW